jgi:3-oxoacyl-[acyl-carrier-protein] synthase III
VIHGQILGISSYVPDQVETNDDLARAHPDWDMERIAAKTGIRARHIAAEGETANDLAYAAARGLLSQELVPIETIDFLIVCTQTPDHLLPANACLLHQRLGLPPHVATLDFNGGCTGYVLGLQLAASLVESRAARHVLLVNADTYSKLVHPRDRTVRTLFGDGAAATLVGAADAESSGRIGPFVHGTSGDLAGELIVPAGGFRTPYSESSHEEFRDEQGCVRSPRHLYMNGQAIFSFALSRLPSAMLQLQEKAGLAAGDIDWYVFHQANRYMLESLAGCSRIPVEKMVMHLEHVGNTVSSSIPLAIEAYCKSERITSGHRLLLAGFGVGLTWSLCLVTWR